MTHWQRSWCWEKLRAEEKGVTEDDMVGWHHQLNRHEFEQAPGDSKGQRSLACCGPWGCKELTYWLNNSDKLWRLHKIHPREDPRKDTRKEVVISQGSGSWDSVRGCVCLNETQQTNDGWKWEPQTENNKKQCPKLCEDWAAPHLAFSTASCMGSCSTKGLFTRWQAIIRLETTQREVSQC